MVSARTISENPLLASRATFMLRWQVEPVAIDSAQAFLDQLRTHLAADWLAILSGERVRVVSTAPRHANAVPTLSLCPSWADGTLSREPAFEWSLPESRTGEHWRAVRVLNNHPATADASDEFPWLLAIWKYRDGLPSSPRVSLVAGVVCLDQTAPAPDFFPAPDQALTLLLWAAGRFRFPETRLEALPSPMESTTPTLAGHPTAPQSLDDPSLDTHTADSLAASVAGELAALLELTQFVQSAPSVAVAAQLLAAHLFEYLDCSAAWTAVADDDRSPQLFDADGALTRPAPELLSAIEETRLRETLVTVVPGESEPPPASLCLRRYARATKSLLVALAVPLPNQKASLVIVVGWPETADSVSKADRAARFCAAAAEPVAAALALVRTAHQSITRRLWTSIAHNAASRPMRLAAGLLTMLAVVLAVPLPDPVHAPLELEPCQKRFVTTPFDARLATTLVRPGDLVTQGQPLARFDDRDLLTEREETAAAIHKAATERDGHLAQHEEGLAELDRLEIERLSARHNLIVSRLDRLEVQAPLTGLVVSGDLDQSLGAPLKAGQVLFEIAPLDRLRGELLIAESDRSLIAEGHSVDVHLDSLPDAPFPATILRIRPRTEIRQDQYGFIAELELADPQGRLRPGMRGAAQVQQPWRPLAIRLFRKPWQAWQVHGGL
jgi:multidrug efflux pump subunit AcrA (membrane-fusion protein)